MNLASIIEKVDDILKIILPKAFFMAGDLDNAIFSRAEAWSGKKNGLTLLACEVVNFIPALAILQDQLSKIYDELQEVSNALEEAHTGADPKQGAGMVAALVRAIPGLTDLDRKSLTLLIPDLVEDNKLSAVNFRLSAIRFLCRDYLNASDYQRVYKMMDRMAISKDYSRQEAETADAGEEAQ